MNVRLPKILALSLSAIVVLIMIWLTLKEYHAAAMMRNLVLILYFGATVIATGVAFALGWLFGSVYLYIYARQSGLSGRAILVNLAGMVIALLIVSLALLTWGWYRYKSYIEHKVYSPATTTAELDDLSRNYLVNRTVYLKIYLAQHPSVSSVTLARLYTSPSVPVRKAVCRNPHVGLEVMMRCAAESSSEVLTGVAGNPVTPQPILERLSHHSYYVIRAQVGFNSKTNPTILARLSRDKNAEVRASIVYHPELSEQVLMRLARDPARLVRLRIASNIHTPVPVLLMLARDADEVVRWALLRPQMPMEVLDILANDQSDRIRQMAARYRESKAKSQGVLR